MTEIKTRLPSGVPCWIDLGVPDYRRAMDFYGVLLGWEFEVGPPELDHYTHCFVRGLLAAAVSTPPEATTLPEWDPYVPWWRHYFCVDSCDRTAKRITDAGGTTPMPPLELLDLGGMAVAADPSGAMFALWRSRRPTGRYIGSHIVDEPGSMTWNELRTDDPATARTFYHDVFDYEMETRGGPDLDYTVLKRKGHPTPIGGIHGTSDPPGPGGRAHWLTYFGVEDADAAARVTAEQGGSVREAPEDTPCGRRTVLVDPFGALFGAVEMPGRTLV
jgi:uncharacterized protein